MRNVLRISAAGLSAALLAGCMLDGSERIDRQRKAQAERDRQEQAEENLHRMEATCQGLEKALDGARDESALDRQRLARLEQEVHDLKPAPMPKMTEKHEARQHAPSDAHAHANAHSKQAPKAGDDLARIQAALKRAGFDPGPVDGKMGAKTLKALEDFQRQNGLKVDGKAGPQTLAKLKPFLSDGGAGEASPEAPPAE